MRKSVVETAALAALLLCAALASCQQAVTPPPKTEKVPEVKDQPAKSKLEEMLQKALQDNPDLRLAAVKLAQAEAELNRARLQVVRKVGAAYQAVEAQKAAVRTAAAELERMKQLSGQNAVESRLVDVAEDKLLDAKAKLAALETEMPYLLGKQPANNTALPTGAGGGAGFPGMGGFNPGAGALGGRFGALGGGLGALGGGLGQLGGGFGALGGGNPFTPADDPEAPKPVPVLGKTAERIRAALDKPFSLELKDTSLSEVISKVSAEFQKANPGLLIKCNIAQDQLDQHVKVQFDKMPLGAVLVWIEDSLGGGRFVVRDYGLIIAGETELPPGAPSLHEFWKGAKGEDKAPAKDQSVNSPSDPLISGLVDKVTSTGLVQLNIGSDVGIAKGNILEAIRLDKDTTLPWAKHKYLGRLRVVKVNAKESVAEPVDKMLEPLKTGDYVTTTQIYGD